jgi:hypothetical protein
MLFSKPIPFAEALASRAVKRILPTTAGSAELEKLAPEIRERALFSARTANAGYLAKMDRLLTNLVDPIAARGTVPGRMSAMSPKELRAELRKELAAQGYIAPDGKAGTLQDLSSDSRLELITNMQVMEAHSYGQFVLQNDPDSIDDAPCLELVRGEQRKEPRDWQERWVRAGGSLTAGRMIARKDDPIWTAINRFGRPYAPFDYGSGMVTREIFRGEAERLGVIKRSDTIKPDTRRLNDSVQMSLPKGNPELTAEVIKAFGRSVIGAGSWLRMVEGLSDDALTAAKSAQAATGAEVMQDVIKGRADAMNAMTRADIEGPIDFRYGDSGQGIAHIVERHGEKMAMRVPDVIALGEIEKSGEHKISLMLDADRVIMTDDFKGKAVNRWVLTAFEKGGAR